MMKAVRLYDKGDIRIETIPVPETPLSDEVLLKVEVAGICGSELEGDLRKLSAESININLVPDWY